MADKNPAVAISFAYAFQHKATVTLNEKIEENNDIVLLQSSETIKKKKKT